MSGNMRVAKIAVESRREFAGLSRAIAANSYFTGAFS
jgi:hypothetical protein